jgi:hypothetical protein
MLPTKIIVLKKITFSFIGHGPDPYKKNSKNYLSVSEEEERRKG